MDQSVLTNNSESKARLFALLDRLSDADLQRPLPDDWTVGASLAHLAFWDRRFALLVAKWQRDGIDAKAADGTIDADVINDSIKPVWLALSPSAVVAESKAAADGANAAVEGLSTELWSEIAGRKLLRLGRDKHRNEHLDEIEALLGGS